MTTPRNPTSLLVAGLFALSLLAPVALSQTPPIGSDSDEGEVLTRGPVHEAFAAVISYNPQAGVTVAKAPPEPIEEIPPDEKPVGEDIAWIPGYWAWDDERSDFLWVSGTWRVLPPGREWVSGYWRQVPEGYQWISGYWADAAASEVTYLPAPPETLERGPAGAAPDDGSAWVPGCWVWRGSRYAWRPGYWMAGRDEWVWIPAYYVWTPRGCVFVDGYWDYAPEQRGMLFAPVYYHDRVYARRGFEYSPSVVLNVGVLVDCLFLRPSYHHYYFGDYYDPRYERSGFFATFTYQRSRRGYDPFYSHSRWEHRSDRDWDRQYRESYTYRRENQSARPARSWSGSAVTINQVNRTTNVTNVNNTVVLAQPLKQYASNRSGGLQVQRIAAENRQQAAEQARQLQQWRQQRSTLEAQAATSSGNGRTSAAAKGGVTARPEPSRAALPRSPIVARSSAESGAHAPPPREPGPAPRQPSERTRGASTGTAARPEENRDNQAARDNRDRPGRDGRVRPNGEIGAAPAAPTTTQAAPVAPARRPDEAARNREQAIGAARRSTETPVAVQPRAPQPAESRRDAPPAVTSRGGPRMADSSLRTARDAEDQAQAPSPSPAQSIGQGDQQKQAIEQAQAAQQRAEQQRQQQQQRAEANAARQQEQAQRAQERQQQAQRQDEPEARQRAAQEQAQRAQAAQERKPAEQSQARARQQAQEQQQQRAQQVQEQAAERTRALQSQQVQRAQEAQEQAAERARAAQAQQAERNQEAQQRAAEAQQHAVERRAAQPEQARASPPQPPKAERPAQPERRANAPSQGKADDDDKRKKHGD